MKFIAAIVGTLLVAHAFADDQTSASSRDASTYTAAVVEYAPLYDKDHELADAKEYMKIINSAEVKQADIIVFPECTLNRIERPAIVPKADDKAIPCDNIEYTKEVQAISCAAKEAQKYVVINLYMQRNCKEESLNDSRPCTRGDINIYNTAVAFDRNGTVVAVYRKFNLFLEDHKVRRTLTPDISIFETDFGVKFGLIICFDLVFKSPTQELLNHGVRNIAYPAMWYSALPFYSAIQIQQSVAYAKNINLLAAGASIPETATTGTGLYSGQYGALKTIFAETATTQVLVGKLPKVPGTPVAVGLTQNRRAVEAANGANQPKTLELRQENLDMYSMEWLNFNENSTQIGKVCQTEVCCIYNISVDVSPDIPLSSPFYSYVIAALDNRMTKVNPVTGVTVKLGMKSCSLIACTSWHDLSSCGKRIGKVHSRDYERYTFEQLKLSTHLRHQPDTLSIMPNTVTPDILPFNTGQFSFVQKLYEDIHNNKLQQVILNLEEPKSDILTFSIFIRDYSRDLITNSAGKNIGTTALTIAFATVLLQLVR